MTSRAVVLLSGGLDSATAGAMARAEGREIHALSFSYGQRHTLELRMAAINARRLEAAEHLILELDPEPFRGSSLTGTGRVPRGGSTHGIPSTYVPARNTVFLAIALGIAETRGAGEIFIGVNSVDYSGYPDCRPAYINAFQELASMATKAAVEGAPTVIRAPLLLMSKAEIVRRGLELGVDYGSTISCYDPDDRGRSCGSCDACLLRLEAFRANGIQDPAPYV
ncbi:MAG TPA: 7-cyano-7-deazaguanine synthase QueC [Candidatus Sabulitectum sp.]|nr:7-cyano-7-deazaguanine synthase QueC [Candidatus Sabulitectum sp.]